MNTTTVPENKNPNNINNYSIDVAAKTNTDITDRIIGKPDFKGYPSIPQPKGGKRKSRHNKKRRTNRRRSSRR